MQVQKSLWGAHLFVPANNAGFLTRLPLLDIKNIIIDLEYSTKIPYKIDGRYLCKNAVSYLRKVRPDISICVRVNLFKTGALFKEDVITVAKSLPDAIRIPSVSCAEEVMLADALISSVEEDLGVLRGTIKLHPMIETPLGLRNAAEIVSASSRVEALCLGGEDWAYNCGLERTKAGEELDYVKYELVSIASQYSVVPVDSVFLWLEDCTGLEQDSLRSFGIGMKARATTNPRQIAKINGVYRPSETKISWAKNMLEALEEVDVHGTKQFVCNGVISDPLAIFQAKQILQHVALA